jgi:hypothetical protein
MPLPIRRPLLSESLAPTLPPPSQPPPRSCFITERFGPLNFLLSAELEHASKNYKFGFGFSLGE